MSPATRQARCRCLRWPRNCSDWPNRRVARVPTLSKSTSCQLRKRVKAGSERFLLCAGLLVLNLARTAGRDVHFGGVIQCSKPEGCLRKQSRQLDASSCQCGNQPALRILNILSLFYYLPRSRWADAPFHFLEVL